MSVHVRPLITRLLAQRPLHRKFGEQIATHLIRQQTGHASDATMSRYIREGSLFRGNAAGQLL